MILCKMTLTNVGLFRGTHEFQLSPKITKSKTRPITLIGGMNGAGKTTILNSLRLCLYGAEVLGPKVSRRAYEKYLAHLIHRPKNLLIKPNDASIQIEFEHAYLGITDIYQIRRNWTKNGSGVKEELAIRKNGDLLQELVSEQWQTFLKDLIPPGLSGLFFFDGEKIQNLADDVQGSEELANSIKALLGLDLAERLRIDLNIYVKKKISNTSDTKLYDQFNAVESDISALKKQKKLLDQERAKIESSKQLVTGKIEAKERKLEAEGGDFANSRTNLITEDKLLADKQGQLENYIRSMCATNLPFALVPDLCKELLEQLKEEEKLMRKLTAEKQLKKITRQMKRGIMPKLKAAGYSKKSSQKILEIFKEWVDSKSSSSRKKEIKIIHGLSPKEKSNIENVLYDAIESISIDVKKTAASLHKIAEKRRSIQSSLDKAPAEELLKPIMNSLGSLNQKLGQYAQKTKTLNQEIQSIVNKISELERYQTKLIEKKAANHKIYDSTSLAVNVRKAMDSYIRKITKRKLEQLNHVVLNKYSLLSRKTDAVKSISIDPKTFKVSLSDASGKKIAKDELSAGEKQIFAVSMLWALASTSGRLLPVVIDTPLGRLDSSHRSNLIKNYFPFASHQIVILSTDTEVDKNLYKKLSPYISHAYHLKYDESEKVTTTSPGYFWKNGE